MKMKPLIFLFLWLCISVVFSFDELGNFENNVKEVLKSYSWNVEEKVDISGLSLESICKRDIGTKNVSSLCAAQMDVVCNDPSLWKPMADAWSKFPYTGMLVATRQEWGTFDECIAIDRQAEDEPRVLGKHCANGLVIPFSADIIYALSYCVPDACSATDLAKMISILSFNETIVEQLINEIYCTTKETNTNLDSSSITVAALFCCFLGLIIVSTTYDVYLHNRQIENRRPILTAFSVFTNGQKLVKTAESSGTNKEQILVFHGLKVISMMWVVAGHNAGLTSILPGVNSEKIEEYNKSIYFFYIASGHLAVDTFFYISGFLLAYIYFKRAAQMPIMEQVMAVPKMIIHRYLRITPAVLMVFLYSLYLGKHIGNGPTSSQLEEFVSRPCRQHWWAVFLYIQNYYNPTELCLTQLWYLSADWQLFLLSPLVLIPIAMQFRKRFKLVLVELLLLNVFFMLLPLCTKLSFPDFNPPDTEYDTHSQLITYFMGITFGLYLRCQRHRPYAFKGVLNILMWFVTLVAMFGTTLVLQAVTINGSYNAKAYCHTFMRPVWCLGLTFITYSCTYGKGGIVNWMMSAGGMQILSKLTYCMYITHGSVIFFWTKTRRTKQYFSDFDLFFSWCGHFIITIIVAVIWTLAFESPLITIERYILGGGGPKTPKKKDGN